MHLQRTPNGISHLSTMQNLYKIIYILLVFAFFSVGDAYGFLRVSGSRIVDAADKPVRLQGLNIEFKDFMTVLNEDDIKKIADSGANSIRLAFNYLDLEQSPFAYNKKNFELLDLVIDWCERHGILVVLDMHLVPGIQNIHDFVVNREKSAEFWNKREFQERFYALWTHIAARYRDRKIIAGYDLINEGSPPDISLYIKILNTVAGKIRALDKNHILIVEEAIHPARSKELVLIDDKNTVYSIHFFYPPQFTFYATTTERPISSYPGKMLTAGNLISEIKSAAPAGNEEWQIAEIKASPPEGSEVLMVNIISEGNQGAIFFDDIRLAVDGHEIDLPAPLVSNNSFEIDYPGFNWDTTDSCVKVSDTTAKIGKHSLSFLNCRHAAAAHSSPIQVQNRTYVLKAWYKSRSASGKTYISLSWHAGRILSTIEKSSLLEQINYAIAFKSRHNVPLYVGEFTAHANPSKENVANYLSDLLDIMVKEGFHWSFWEYYSHYRGVGIHNGPEKAMVNPAAWDTLKKYMK